jgi:hypothetical protein
MKKKYLLLTLLALAIVTSLTAGTLAVYTKSVSMNAVVEIKKFAFAAAGKIEGEAKSINLAPTETKSYNFTVTNYEGETGSPAEVALDYTVFADFADAAKKMPGLTAVLTKDGVQVAAANVNGTITYANTTLAGTATKHEYVIKLTWAGNDNTAQTSAGLEKAATNGLQVTVTAVQHI